MPILRIGLIRRHLIALKLDIRIYSNPLSGTWDSDFWPVVILIAFEASKGRLGKIVICQSNGPCRSINLCMSKYLMSVWRSRAKERDNRNSDVFLVAVAELVVRIHNGWCSAKGKDVAGCSCKKSEAEI
jgi:hypothetical protein